MLYRTVSIVTIMPSLQTCPFVLLMMVLVQNDSCRLFRAFRSHNSQLKFAFCGAFAQLHSHIEASTKAFFPLAFKYARGTAFLHWNQIFICLTCTSTVFSQPGFYTDL